jgi:DNA polymerase III subunit beta
LPTSARAPCAEAGKRRSEISASSTEAGESEDSIEAPYDGETLTIGFNAQYLVDFLKAAGTSEVRLELKDSQSAGQLRPAEGDDYKYRYIVMPMRI